MVIDESHRIRNLSSQQGLVCRQMAAAATFTSYPSATAGQSPHGLSYLGRLLTCAVGGQCGDLDEFRVLMKRLRIGRVRGRWENWSWEPSDADRRLMSDLLYKGDRAIGLRRRPEDIAGWPEVQRELAPTALDPASQRLYDATWREFRRELGCGEDTVEEKIAAMVTARMSAMDGMAGDDTGLLDEIAQILAAASAPACGALAAALSR